METGTTLSLGGVETKEKEWSGSTKGPLLNSAELAFDGKNGICSSESSSCYERSVLFMRTRRRTSRHSVYCFERGARCGRTRAAGEYGGAAARVALLTCWSAMLQRADY